MIAGSAISLSFCIIALMVGNVSLPPERLVPAEVPVTEEEKVTTEDGGKRS
jgi:hypothetical protein